MSVNIFKVFALILSAPHTQFLACIQHIISVSNNTNEIADSRNISDCLGKSGLIFLLRHLYITIDQMAPLSFSQLLTPMTTNKSSGSKKTCVCLSVRAFLKQHCNATYSWLTGVGFGYIVFQKQAEQFCLRNSGFVNGYDIWSSFSRHLGFHTDHSPFPLTLLAFNKAI